MLLWSYERHIPPFLFLFSSKKPSVWWIADHRPNYHYWHLLMTVGKRNITLISKQTHFILVHDFMSAIHMDLTDYVIHLYSYVQENMFNSILTWYNDIVYRSDWNLLFIWNRRKHPYIQLIKTQIFDAVHAFKERWKR